MPLDLLQIIACPTCKGELIRIADGTSLRCTSCFSNYPVVDAVPILLPVQASTVPQTQPESP